MRLSQWRTRAPVRDALGPKVSAVIAPLLVALGAEPDPHAWVAWGDDPASRYPVLVPTDAGLIVCHVRVNAAGEGPRASAKLVRWSRVQLGELGAETLSGHHIVSFQVEGQVLRGADEEADAISAFAIRLFAGADGRPIPPAVEGRARPARGSAGNARTKAASNGRGSAAKSPPGATSTGTHAGTHAGTPTGTPAATPARRRPATSTRKP